MTLSGETTEETIQCGQFIVKANEEENNFIEDFIDIDLWLQAQEKQQYDGHCVFMKTCCDCGGGFVSNEKEKKTCSKKRKKAKK